MFYCKYCSNTLEIIKNTNISIDDKIKIIESPTKLFEIYLEDLESKKNNFINSDFQYKINWPEGEINSLNIKNLLKNLDIDNSSDESVKNNLIKKYRDIVKSQKNVSIFYLSCTNCSTTYFLEPETLIESINLDKNSNVKNDYDDIKSRIHDPTLARTKDYICPNSKCKTNLQKNSKEILIEKEAVFYRTGKEYNIKYICCQCNTQWGT